MNEKVKAAILAAIQAYLDQEQAAEGGHRARRSRWLRQARAEAVAAAQPAFERGRRWR